MKKLISISSIFALLLPIPLLAATNADATNLYIQNLTVNAYSLETTFTAGNNGGQAGYATFSGTAEMQKRVKTSYILKNNGQALFTYVQEWNDPKSEYTSYWQTGAEATLTSTAFGNRALPYIETGKAYEISVCLDAANAVQESSESDNCATSIIIFNVDPSGDADNDGLTNAEEAFLGTNANNPDTDGDGLTDVQEVDITLTNPTLFDTYTDDAYASDYELDNDHDGLSNGFEINDNAPVGTQGNFSGEGGNPNNPDTDEDGLGDLIEYLYAETCALDITIDDGNHNGTKDADEDCDLDNATNIVEISYATSLDNPDTDGDGTLDGEEIYAGTNPLDAASFPTQTLDTDGDGLTDAQEASIGTDEANPDTDGDYYTDFEEITAPTPSNPLEINSTPGRYFDSDGDGLSDHYDRDDDNDGIKDVNEAALGTSPRNPDTDGDGTADAQDRYPTDATQQ